MSYGYAPTPIPPMVPQPSWFSQNWKWFLPTIILGPLLLLALFIGGILTFVFGMMKSSEPYHHAVATAQNNPEVLRELGDPVEPGWFTSGSINLSGSSGAADMAISLNGKLRHGSVHVIANESGGTWTYQKLEVFVDGHDTPIQLLPDPVLPENPDLVLPKSKDK
jgi:hypothetical protein